MVNIQQDARSCLPAKHNILWLNARGVNCKSAHLRLEVAFALLVTVITHPNIGAFGA